MMRSSIYRALDKMNELEKEVDRLDDKAYDKEQEGKTKLANHYTRKAEDIQKEIEGMATCLRILGMNPWVQCDYDTNHVRVWHIPLDDIETVC